MQKIHYTYIEPFEGRVPLKTTRGAANFDLYAAEECLLWPHQLVAISTGLKMAVPEGFVLEIYPRSGLVLKHGITVANSPGQVDSDYRGEVKVLLYNLGTHERPYRVRKGDRIAQCRIVPVVDQDFHWVLPEDLDETERGEGGFGSTGF